jgi:hypothetical protein
MPSTATTLPVEGRTQLAADGPLLVLDQRLTGHDTFLTGVLEVEHVRINVRILTLDDLTVLQPVLTGAAIHCSSRWAGILHLPHGQRRRAAPVDLREAAGLAGRNLDDLDDADLHYALTFLEEATTPEIRKARIQAIAVALPPTPTEMREGTQSAH